MKVKYKVVKRRNRMSSMINGNSKYARKYLDGVNVHADNNTVGIFVFDTLTKAKDWISTWNYFKKDLIVLKVIPFGRGKRIDWISEGGEDRISAQDLHSFYSGDVGERNVQEPPDGTMTYPGVYVIGEY